MFFMMEEDKRIQNRIRFRDIESGTHIRFEPDEIPQIHDVTVLFMSGNSDSIYPAVFETPVYMICDALKRLIEPYDPSVIYRRVALNQTGAGRQEFYWLLLPEEIDCADDGSEWYPNGWSKRLILNREKIGDRRIFTVKGLQVPKVIVSWDVSECILRRSFEGILYQPVEVK